MSTSKTIYETLSASPFSYGEALSTILENKGTPISSLPNEDFVFPDSSVLRLTHTGISLLEYLQE